jgi:hypothetical protein
LLSFKKQLPKDLPQDFVEVIALQTWMYIRLKGRIGMEKAYEVVRALVIPVGLAVQQSNFRCVGPRRTFEHLIIYMQRTNREGPTRWNKLDLKLA